MHKSLAELEAGLPLITEAPTEQGTVVLIVRRPGVDEREVLDACELDVAEGLVGDHWRARGNRHTPDGSANIDAQLTIMNARVAALIAGPRERWPLAGEQLYVDFDISEANLPAGTRLQIGEAVIEVSAHPHTGCKKFTSRFGADALRFASTTEGRALNIRGINTRVIEPGTVRTGDPIAKA